VAKFQYGRIVEYLQFSDNLGGAEGLERNSLVLAAHLNSSLCSLKQEDYSAALDSAERALEIDPKSVKALFRRGLVK
jgi:Tfp pilus assembly protein PilF